MWPRTSDELLALQEAIGRARPGPWRPPSADVLIGGCAVCFGVTSDGVEQAWAAAALVRGGKRVAASSLRGTADVPYAFGLMALREGALLEAAVRALPERPEVLLVHAGGRDHPRGAGLALQLGAALDLPTVGVTERPLRARGDWPQDVAGASSPLRLDGEIVGAWVRTAPGAKPVAVHAAWRTSHEVAIEVVLMARSGHRLPEPLRIARAEARRLRARDTALAGG